LAASAARSRRSRRAQRSHPAGAVALRASAAAENGVAAVAVAEKIPASKVKELRARSQAGILDSQKALRECDGDMEKAMEWLRKKGIAKADKKSGNQAVEGACGCYVHHNSSVAVLVEVNCETDFAASGANFKEFVDQVAMQIASNPDVTGVSTDEVPEDIKAKEKELEMAKDDLDGKPDEIKEKIVAGRLQKRFSEMALLEQKWVYDEDKKVADVLKEMIAKVGENIVIRRFVRLNLGEGIEKEEVDFAAGVAAELEKFKPTGEPKEEKPKEEKPAPVAEKPKEASAPKMKIPAAAVKELRERSGAGILDSQKALRECEGDMDKAMDWLKKRGIAKADKKAGNAVAEGAIGSYVHFNSKLAVLVEINCETDFAATNDNFKEFVDQVAMQIASNPDVTGVSTDEVPEDVKAKEKELEMAKDDLDGKPEDIKEKIVAGRLQKRFSEMALLDQKWILDDSKTVADVLKEKIAKIGENIVIRRFVRLNLGEGLEKVEADLAAAVAAEIAK